MTPLKAIRKYCVDNCMAGSSKEVSLCVTDECPLYDLRLNKNVKKISVLKAIQARCMDCSSGSPSELKNCTHIACEIFKYRTGRNPKRKGIGGNPSLKRKEGIGIRQFPVKNRQLTVLESPNRE